MRFVVSNNFVSKRKRFALEGIWLWFVIFLTGSPTPVWADEAIKSDSVVASGRAANGMAKTSEVKRPPGVCHVAVRTLVGKTKDPKSTSKRLKTGEYLADLNEQLQPLPFKEYSTLAHEEKDIAIRHRSSFILRGVGDETHSIFVEPHSITKESVHLMVDWQGSDGQELLSTKLSLENGKNWVLGKDNADDSSTIVCIKVNCQPN